MVEFLRGQWREFTDMVDVFSIMLMEGLLIVPIIMFGLFYPVEMGLTMLAILLVSVAIFETVVWVRHHPHHPHHHEKSGWHMPL
jgi:hypothetical protein